MPQISSLDGLRIDWGTETGPQLVFAVQTNELRPGFCLSPDAVIAAYTHRGNIETTFEELRAFIGLETTRGWSRATVLRAEPCLFGLYTIVVLLYAGLPAPWRRVRAVDWPGKRDFTFSDAITAVRRWLWLVWVFGTPLVAEPCENSGVDCVRSCSMPWLRQHEVGRSLPPRAGNRMIMAVW